MNLTIRWKIKDSSHLWGSISFPEGGGYLVAVDFDGHGTTLKSAREAERHLQTVEEVDKFFRATDGPEWWKQIPRIYSGGVGSLGELRGYLGGAAHMAVLLRMEEMS